MRQNTRRLLALFMALAMLMSAFALAEEVPVEVEGEPDVGGELQGLEDEMAIDLDMGEDIMDLETEGDLSLDLNGALELSSEALAPVTGVAMNAGEQDGKTAETAFTTDSWNILSKWIGGLDLEIKARGDGESSENPTYFSYTGPDVNNVVRSIGTANKVTATGKGTCTIWAIANNGVRTGVKVTVK